MRTKTLCTRQHLVTQDTRQQQLSQHISTAIHMGAIDIIQVRCEVLHCARPFYEDLASRIHFVMPINECAIRDT